jgi:hypothetical protein
VPGEGAVALAQSTQSRESVLRPWVPRGLYVKGPIGAGHLAVGVVTAAVAAGTRSTGRALA